METLKFVMTTTFYPPYHLGGDAVHVYQLSNELAKLGHEVHVIHSVDSYKIKRKGEPLDVYPNHENIMVYPIRSPFGRISPIISYLTGSPYPMKNKIHNIIDNVKPDVLHHHNIAGLGPFILGIRAPRVLYTAHDYWLACPLSGLKRYDGSYCTSKSDCFKCSILSSRPPQFWRYTGILDKYLKNINVIIAPSNFMKEKLQEFGVDGNFVTIPNSASEPPKTGKALYNFPYFLFVGVLEEHKGIIDLIDTFLDVESEISAKLLIVGTGSLKDKIYNILAKKDVSDKILVLGRVDDLTLSNLYSNAISVVIPSTWPENCPLVALESLANGTPVIAACRGGLPELKSISNGVYIYNDKSELKSLLREKYIDPVNEVVMNSTVHSYIDKYFSLIGK